MAGTGGKREGAGRPTKVDEEKANTIFLTALKQIYNKETDEEAKIDFVKSVLMDSQRGQLFIAEHIFGKPKETIETTHNVNNFDIKDIFKISNNE
jgi:hypothetical protein